jgi:proteasome lid subunit RPN8/RPN11
VPPPLTLTASAWAALVEQSEKAYPFEGCGLLLGPYGAEKVAEKVIQLRNALREQGRGRFDFTFSPNEFAQAQLAADRENLDIVGIYHTHPDHPARPSATDASQPMLSGWVNVIAGVHGGRFKEAKAWWRDEDSQPFIETELRRPAKGSERA